MEANYSEGGIENQRVIAFRYGRFKYEKTNPDEFNVDRTEMMPELVGISRIGKDGTKTYFVLMPPIDRLKYRDADDKSVDIGDKLLKFTITDDVKVPVLFNKSKTVRKSFNANIVDEGTGKPINIFRNKNIPKQLEEFFAKVYFSDEYLSSAIEKNARYLGSVKEGEDGPYIETADEGKVDLAAAYYAEYFPGIVKGKQVENLSKYCNSGDLAITQFELIRKIRESELRNKTTRPKDEGQGFDD